MSGSVPVAHWRATDGFQGGEVDEGHRFVEEPLTGLGATVIRRNMLMTTLF
jgi:hypothetical protein